MTIEQNENIIDRFIRIILGGACLIVPSYVIIPTPGVAVLMVVGLYLMFSGLSSACVIYRLLKIKTCK
jgi:VIT1/CCC1 family predicted Fe2+/Mn2+ transporter